jgi:DNA helicase TIP49 (TBP-interacting protein)
MNENDQIKNEYEIFWKGIVENKDGSFNKEQIMKELSDYSFLLKQIPRVYEHATGGLMSKCMYNAEDVISRIDDNVNAIVRNRLEDGLGDMVANDLITDSTRIIILSNSKDYI